MSRILNCFLLLLLTSLITCNGPLPSVEKFEKNGRDYFRIKKHHDNGTVKLIATLLYTGDTLLADGVIEEFDRDGNTLNVKSFVNGLMTGSAYYYGDGGSIIKYEFYDPDERLLYKSECVGTIEKEEGSTYPIVASHPYQPDDSLRIYAVNPPYKRRDLIVHRYRNPEEVLKHITGWNEDYMDISRKTTQDTVVFEVITFTKYDSVLSKSVILH